MALYFVAACFDERVSHHLYLAAVAWRDQVSNAAALQESVCLSLYTHTHVQMQNKIKQYSNSNWAMKLLNACNVSATVIPIKPYYQHLDLAHKKGKWSGTSVGSDENGQMDVWR